MKFLLNLFKSFPYCPNHPVLENPSLAAEGKNLYLSSRPILIRNINLITEIPIKRNF